MNHSEIYVFSADAKPMAGGVAEFTHQIAKALRSLDRLGAVITHRNRRRSSRIAFSHRRHLIFCPRIVIRH